MSKRNLLLIYLCLTGIFALNGQNVTVIERNSAFTGSEKQKGFYYIEKDFPLTEDQWIATLDGFCTNTKKSNLESLFYIFRKTANEMGANAFFVKNFLNTTDTIFVAISIFKLTEQELDDNYKLYSCNKIYVFGDFIASDTKAKSREIKVNKKKVTVYPLSYYEHQSEIGEKVNVTIGGAFGSGYTRKAEAGKVSVYLSLGGGTVNPAVNAGGVGINFSTGSIYPLDMNLGQFLTNILNK